LDRTLDHVLGHVGAERLVHGAAQARVGSRVTAAGAGGHRNLADDLGEDLAPLRVLGVLAVLDVRPLGMTGHSKPNDDLRGGPIIGPRAGSRALGYNARRFAASARIELRTPLECPRGRDRCLPPLAPPPAARPPSGIHPMPRSCSRARLHLPARE